MLTRFRSLFAGRCQEVVVILKLSCHLADQGYDCTIILRLFCSRSIFAVVRAVADPRVVNYLRPALPLITLHCVLCCVV